MLYEVALLQKPTQKEREEGKLETVLVAPFNLIAADDRSATLQAVIDNKDKIPDLSRVEVLVRPFI